MPKTGRRQKRIDRFLEKFEYKADINPADLAPVFLPAPREQIKRGYRQKGNDECGCGSGNKYKFCHRELEKATPRWSHSKDCVVVYSPYEDKWVTQKDLDDYIKKYDL
jgi:hypothetical protein